LSTVDLAADSWRFGRVFKEIMRRSETGSAGGEGWLMCDNSVGNANRVTCDGLHVGEYCKWAPREGWPMVMAGAWPLAIGAGSIAKGGEQHGILSE